MNNPSHPTEPPQPFLSNLFNDAAQPIITAGYYYRDIEVAMHGVKNHRAIDFNVPRGTTVYAPADGWYVATYGEQLLRDDNGQTTFISAKQAESVNDSSDLTFPTAKQPWCAYFGSYTIQGWHGQGRYTQFGHMDWVDEVIPYFASLRATGDPRQATSGDLMFNPILRAPIQEYKTKAVFLRKGQMLGVSGASGIGWNARCFDSAVIGQDGRPDFRNRDYTHYDAPHVHFMVFGRRYGKDRQVRDFWDPFGIYGTVEQYPIDVSQLSVLKNSLWI